MEKIICVDMDSVLADFEASEVLDPGLPIRPQVHKMYEHGFFFKLKPVSGAMSGLRALVRLGYDVHILSKPVAESAHSYSEKVQWIGMWFPEFIGKLHLTQEKGLFRGDYLIDDDANKWKDKWEANGGKFIHFQYRRDGDNAAEWQRIIDYFRSEKDGSADSN